MSSDDKKVIDNSFSRISFYEARTSKLGDFLEPGEKFSDRLQKLVKDSLKRPGLDIQKITIGKVLKVVKNAKPIPGGTRDTLNKQNNYKSDSCLQIYVHTIFDAFLPIPNNLNNPGDQECLIYQHYVYEAQNIELELDPPDVGDSVYVFHPLSKGYLNRVGVFMGKVGVAGIPIDYDVVVAQQVFKERVTRKQAIPINLPETDDCFKNPYGDNCAWSGGKVIGKIDLDTVPAPKSNMKARPEVVNAYKRMKRAYEKDNPGQTLQVNSGFRSFKEQEEIRAHWIKKGKPKNAARAGRSLHQNGIAIDINTNKADPPEKITKIYKWLSENATTYGFVRTVKSEPWHWVYYGPTKAAKKVPPWQ
jgi:hypothetical protein